MKDIIILIAGCLLGVLTSWFFSRKGSSELHDTELRVIQTLENNVRELTTQLSASSKLNQYSLTKLRDAGLDEAVKEIGLEAQKEIAAAKGVIKSIPPSIIEGVDTEVFSNTRTCPSCGNESFPAGFGPDQGGSMVYYYQCTEHGRFPSNHIEDMVD